jgi:RTX calcium-binding nonapeptide repeat (4 copies)
MNYGRVLRRLALLAAVGGATLTANTGLALADSTCSYDASFHRVNVYDGSGSSQDLQITRSGQYIVVRNGDNGAISYCSSANGVATVTNTDKVIVDGNATSLDGFVIDEVGGELGPGWTPEADGKSEVEVVFRNANVSNPHLHVYGTSGKDGIRFSGRNQVMLGWDSDVDAQVINKADNSPITTRFGAIGRAGDDWLSADGGSSSSLPPTSMPAMLMGDEGHDTVEGSKSTGGDMLYGYEDNDTIYAYGGGQDFVYGGAGADTAVVDASDYVKEVEQIVK